MRHIVCTAVAVVLLSGCASEMCQGIPTCAAPVLVSADLRKLPEIEVVRVCVGAECREWPASGGGFQGPVGVIPGFTPVRVEFIDGSGNVTNTLVGSGVTKTKCGCSNVFFEADFKRGVLRQTN